MQLTLDNKIGPVPGPNDLYLPSKSFIKYINCIYYNKPNGIYPICLQTTLLSPVFQPLEQTVPQASLTQTSTRPS